MRSLRERLRISVCMRSVRLLREFGLFACLGTSVLASCQEGDNLGNYTLTGRARSAGNDGNASAPSTPLFTVFQRPGRVVWAWFDPRGGRPLLVISCPLGATRPTEPQPSRRFPRQTSCFIHLMG